MKHTYYLFLIAMSLLFTGCSGDIIKQEKKEDDRVTGKLPFTDMLNLTLSFSHV